MKYCKNANKTKKESLMKTFIYLLMKTDLKLSKGTTTINANIKTKTLLVLLNCKNYERTEFGIRRRGINSDNAYVGYLFHIIINNCNRMYLIDKPLSFSPIRLNRIAFQVDDSFLTDLHVKMAIQKFPPGSL